MADSPKCSKCAKKDSHCAQTYRIAGTPNFICHDCREIYHEGLFEKIEFDWKDDTEKWNEFAKQKGYKLAHV